MKMYLYNGDEHQFVMIDNSLENSWIRCFEWFLLNDEGFRESINKDEYNIPKDKNAVEEYRYSEAYNELFEELQYYNSFQEDIKEIDRI